MRKGEDNGEEQELGRVAPNMEAGGSHTQATTDPEEEEAAEEGMRDTRRLRWADCDDDEGKEEEEQETEGEGQEEAKGKKRARGRERARARERDTTRDRARGADE